MTASGFVLPPSDQLRDEIYSQLLTRAYINQHGAQIMLLIAYNPLQDGFVQIHRPEVCYPASGYQITRSTKHITRLTAGVNVPSRYLEAENSVRREKVLYWTRTGDAFPRNWAEQRWAIFDQNLDGLIPDGLLIRISSADDDADLGLLDRFASDLFDNVGPDMRRIMAWT